MQSLLLGLCALVCPVGMGVMMWMMNRSQKTGQQPDQTTDQLAGGGSVDGQQQVVKLRAEIDQLKAERAERHPAGGR